MVTRQRSDEGDKAWCVQWASTARESRACAPQWRVTPLPRHGSPARRHARAQRHACARATAAVTLTCNSATHTHVHQCARRARSTTCSSLSGSESCCVARARSCTVTGRVRAVGAPGQVGAHARSGSDEVDRPREPPPLPLRRPRRLQRSACRPLSCLFCCALCDGV